MRFWFVCSGVKGDTVSGNDKENAGVYRDYVVEIATVERSPNLKGPIKSPAGIIFTPLIFNTRSVAQWLLNLTLGAHLFLF